MKTCVVPVTLGRRTFHLEFVQVGAGWWPTNLIQPGLGRLRRTLALRLARAQLKAQQ